MSLMNTLYALVLRFDNCLDRVIPLPTLGAFTAALDGVQDGNWRSYYVTRNGIRIEHT